MTTISMPVRLSGKVRLRTFLLICGILSSLLYVGMNIFVPMFFEGYNSASQTVSELSAIGAPTRALWIWLGALYTLLIIAFGLGLLQSAGQNRNLRIVGGFLIAYGIIGIAWPFAPMHQREVLATGEKTLTDTMHLVMAAISVFFMTISMGFGGAAFGRGFRLYSIGTILILIIFGILTAFEAPRVEKNLPTPWVGVWERINIGVFLLWTVVLAIVVLRKKKIQSRIKN